MAAKEVWNVGGIEQSLEYGILGAYHIRLG